MNVDNFELVKKHILKFKEKGAFFVVPVINRKKDSVESAESYDRKFHGWIKMWTFYSVEEYEKCIPDIKRLCEANHARAYILPQRRTTHEVLKHIASESIRLIDEERINIAGLCRSAVCGIKSPKDRRFLFDIDYDPSIWPKSKECTIEAVAESVAAACRKHVGPERADDVVVLPTVSGWHVVSPRFELVQFPVAGKTPFADECLFYRDEWVKEDEGSMTMLYYKDLKEV